MRASTLGAQLLLATLAPLAFASAAQGSPSFLPATTLGASTFAECPMQATMGPSGSAVALWSVKEGETGSVRAATRAPGSAWAEGGTLRQAGPPCVQGLVTNARGDVAGVWEAQFKDHPEDKVPSYHLIVGFRAAGGAWQQTTVVDEGTTETLAPDIAMDGAGDVTLVWRSNQPGHTVEAAFKPAGGAWQAAAPVSPETNNAYQPHVAMDQAGDTYVIWQHEPETSQEVIASAFRPAGGSWRTPVMMSVPAKGVLRAPPRIFMNPAGEAVAVWAHWDGANAIIQTSTARTAEHWEPAFDLSRPGKDAEVPHAAIDARGDEVAVWERKGEANTVIQAASRPAGSAWTAPATLSQEGHDAHWPSVELGPAGEAVAAWERFNGSNVIDQAATGSPAGVWQPAVDLSPTAHDGYTPSVSGDGAGNGLIAWESREGSSYTAVAVGYDGAAPSVGPLSLPQAYAGEPVTLAANPLDVWSALAPSSWAFGDGTAGTGTSVAHTYAAPGTYSVVFTTADVLGNQATATGTIAVAPSRRPPVISRLQESAGRWRAGRSTARISVRRARPPVGTTFTFTLDRPAAVTLAFTRQAFGHRRGRRCVSSGRGRRCALTLPAGSLTLAAHAGVNRVVFQGVLARGRRMRPGGYKLTLTARNQYGAAAASLGFTIVR